MDGTTLPPAGSPNYFMGSMDNGGPYGAPQDALTLWKFTADFTTPAISTFTLANTIPIAAYDTMFSAHPRGAPASRSRARPTRSTTSATASDRCTAWPTATSAPTSRW